MTPHAESVPGWAFVLTWSPEKVGGVNEVVFALAEQVRRRGYAPILVIATWEGAPQPSAVRGIEVVSLRLREPISPAPPHRWLPGAFKTLFADASALLRLVRRRNIAVWNPHFPGLECIVPVWLRRTGLLKIPVVISMHGLDVTVMKKTGGAARRTWRKILRRADAVVAVSAALQAEITEFDSRATTLLIHNGVNAETFAGSPAECPLSSTILHIGKYEHKKAQDVLLHAFRQLLDDGVAAKLVLVGASGPALAQTRSLVAELRLTDDVSMYVDLPHAQIPEMLRAATVFALPSRAEPFGLVLLEAGAAGVPIVASAVGGIPEVLQDEVTGLLIPPEDVQALKNALQRLLVDRSLRDRLSRTMRKNVLENWSWDRAGGDYCRLLSEQRP